MTDYKKNSLTLLDAVSMGTGVIIGAGIFALTGQIAELAGPLFPVAFLVGAVGGLLTAICTGYFAMKYWVDGAYNQAAPITHHQLQHIK